MTPKFIVFGFGERQFHFTRMDTSALALFRPGFSPSLALSRRSACLSNRTGDMLKMLLHGDYANAEYTGFGASLLRLGGSGKANLDSVLLRRARSHVP